MYETYKIISIHSHTTHTTLATILTESQVNPQRSYMVHVLYLPLSSVYESVHQGMLGWVGVPNLAHWDKFYCFSLREKWGTFRTASDPQGRGARGAKAIMWPLMKLCEGLRFGAVILRQAQFSTSWEGCSAAWSPPATSEAIQGGADFPTVSMEGLNLSHTWNWRKRLVQCSSTWPELWLREYIQLLPPEGQHVPSPFLPPHTNTSHRAFHAQQIS